MQKNEVWITKQHRSRSPLGKLPDVDCVMF